jgi:hypothetical protein
LHHGPRWLAGIEYATAAFRQAFAGAARLVVAGMVQNKDVTGPAPDPIISMPHSAPRSRVPGMHAGKSRTGVGTRHEDQNQDLARRRRFRGDRDGGNGGHRAARPRDVCLAERAVLPVVGAAAGGKHLAQDADHAQEAGEGGEAGTLASLPPELAFAVRVALLRGHLLVGDELVKQQQWNAALPHFLHPTEEIYGDIQGELAGYNVPPFDGELKALVQVVKGRQGGADYAKALKAINDALAAADAGVKARQSNWSGFVVEAAVETLKAASGEYNRRSSAAGWPSRSNTRTHAASSGRLSA